MEHHPKSIIVRSPNWIGDQILAYPFFSQLRAKYPEAEITAVCVPWVKNIQFRNFVNDVIDFKKLDDFRYKSFDLGYVLPNSFSSAWHLYRSGAKVRRGYATQWRSLFLTERVHWNSDPAIHRAQSYLNLLPTERLSVRVQAVDFWKNNLFEPGVSWPNSKPLEVEGTYWVLSPGSTAESRRWDEQSFLDLGRKIFSETGWKGVIVGGHAESALAHSLFSRFSEGLVNLVGRGEVCDLWKIFRGSKFTVSNESGLAHVAALCGSKVQIVCGAADPKRTIPLGPGGVHVRVNPVECWPCERNTCLHSDQKKFQCLKGIKADEIWQDIKKNFL